MTTIAWDGKTLAVDRGSWSGYVVNKTTKLFPPALLEPPSQFSNGWPMGAFAFTGSAGLCMAILAWANGGEKPVLPDEEKKNSHGVLVTLDSRVFRISGWLHLEPIQSIPFSDGGGQEVAIGALLAGADSKRAVEIAGQRTNLSWFGVDTWEPPCK